MKKIAAIVLFLLCSIYSNAQLMGLWGVTYYQGPEFGGNGVIFQWCNNTAYNVMHIFAGGPGDGANPDCTLFKAADGNLYGTTAYGGANGGGTIYEFNLGTMAYSMKYSMSFGTGYEPWGGALIQPVAANPVLYGMTGNGGANLQGCIFTYNYSTNTYTDIHDFGSTLYDGWGPNNGTPLYDAASGLIYVVTKYGGNTVGFHQMGALLSFNPANIGGTYTLLYTFQTGVFPNYGNEPIGIIAEASNGIHKCLYGTTIAGGSNGDGVIWQYDLTTNTYTDIHDYNGVDGWYPNGLIYDGTYGLLYGLNYEGGTNNWGNLFSINPVTHAYTILHQFVGGNTDAAYAEGQLYVASDGELYGMASEGGNNPANSGGLIFQFNPATNAFKDEYDLQPAGGVEPFYSGLTEADVPICGALPITLESFTAECDNHTALLQWTTGTETNNDHFTIERSTDGVNYQVITTVKGSGNSSTSRSYSATDDSPLSGISYYRLSQTDIDGTTVIVSTVPYTHCENTNAINAYTTAENNIAVQINSSGNDIYTISLINTLGQTIYSASRSVVIGANSFNINPSLAEGVYIIRITGQENTFTKKLLLSNIR